MTGITTKDDGHNIKWISTVPKTSLKIFDIKDAEGNVFASMNWVGLSKMGTLIYQPCIKALEKLRVVYDGECISSFGESSIINPSWGTELFYEEGNDYYFRSASQFPSTSPDTRHNLTGNNASMRFSNISLFRDNSDCGVAMDFRASFQTGGRSEDGCVIVLASRLIIELPEVQE